MDYNKVLSKRVRDVKPSGIRKYFDLLNEMEDVISLGVGEPDFITDESIRQAAIDSINNCQTKYTSNAGSIEMREAVSEYMKIRFDLSYRPKDEILVTVGASEALDLALSAIIDEGDEILVPEPCYVSYAPCVSMCGGVAVPVVCTVDNHFKVTPEMLMSKITNKTKALILAFPSNPTGAIMTREDLEKIVPMLIEKDILVISDEIYAELTYGRKHVSIANLESMKERTVVVNGLSKSFSMTGWRLGFLCAPAELVSQMYKIHQFSIMCAPTASQFAGVFALKNGVENNFKLVEDMKNEYDSRRKFLLESFKEMEIPCFEPQGAFYVFPCIKHLGVSSDEFATQMLKQKKVLVVPGEAFGESGHGYLRCCYATSMKNLVSAMARMKEYVAVLKANQK